MPELPEVETVRRGLLPAMQGAAFERVLVQRGDLRWPLQEDFVGRLEGKTVRRLGRRAKYLLAYLASGDVLIMHLGMSGSFRVSADRNAETGRHDHVAFHMGSGATIVFNDPRRFGFMKIVTAADLGNEPLLCGLGLEPLDAAFDAAALAAACLKKAAPLKSALLDQRVVAGLGNIYVCESLHRAGISPRRRAATIGTRAGLPTDRARRLVESIKAVLEEAIRQGGSSLRDHRRTDGELGAFQLQFRVYGRESENCPASGCGGIVHRIVQCGRSTFFCPACQR